MTGLSRLIMGNDQGVFSVVDNNGVYFNRLPDGVAFDGAAAQMLTPANNTDPAQGSRNGNLQMAQFNFGALQPSTTAATNVDGLIYGAGEGLGVPSSDPGVVDNGNLNWNGPGALDRAVDVETDQQGNGTVYSYIFPSTAANSTDFFQVDGVSRTFGLLQQSLQGLVPDPQWPYFSSPAGALTPTPGTFTVNPLNGDSIVISSAVGRIFATEDQGRVWAPIAEPTDLDSSYVPVLTFGAPDPNGPGGVGNLNNYILAGTQKGHIFVTFTGGGGVGNIWTDISGTIGGAGGLDGSTIQGIVADPTRGSHDVYAVTQKGVYFMADTSAASHTWVNITGVGSNSVLAQTHTIFGDPTQTEKQAKSLTSIIADWRYSVPDNPALSNSPTHPVLYVAGDSGVYRSIDKGQTWRLFPNQATDGSVSADGGLLPTVPVTDLDMSLGNIDPTTGQPQMTIKDAQGTVTTKLGSDLLVATTFGRGSYAIRVAPLVQAMGLSTGGNVTGSLTPTITGYSEQTAFGNSVTVRLFDVTDPANRVLVGTGTTDATGKFSITLNPGFSFGGLRTIAAEATDDIGVTGPDAKFSLTVNANQPPKISIADTSLTEGNNGSANMTFQVTLDKAGTSPITVNYATADGTASTADNDYTQKTGTVTFAAGQTSQTITVPIIGDTKFETNETFTVNLSGASGNSQILKASATGTITNDDTQPTITISSAQANEGNTGTSPVNFNLTLSNPSSSAVTVNFTTSDGTATVADNDYVAATGTVTFAPGSTSQTISVLANGDTKVENNETFGVALSLPINATLTNSTATGTILNDDSGLGINITDVSQAEGNSGSSGFTFNVTLTQPSANTVTVAFATADGTATVADSDYQANSGTLTFTPGQTSKTVVVQVNGDTKVEANETFNVNLSSATGGASISRSQGVGTITNDDVASPVGISISDVTKAEGNTGTTPFVFNVTLDKAPTSPVTVSFATSSNTATSPSDFTANSGTLTFAVGQTTQTITVNVNGDTVVESDESFNVTLSSPSGNASLVKATGVGTIQNDDSGSLPGISINDVSKAEGNSGNTAFTFNVTLSSPAAAAVTVNFATANGTATSGSDYTANSGTVTFAAGQTSQTVTVQVTGDTNVEPDETFFVNLSSARPTPSSSTARARARSPMTTRPSCR